MNTRVKCKNCSNLILPETAALFAGKCAVCAKTKPKPNLPKKFNSLAKMLTGVDFQKYDQTSVNERLTDLTQALASAYEALPMIPMPLRAVYVTETIEQEACNGGLAQAFANVPLLFDHAVAGYLELGLQRSVEIVQRIVSLLPSEAVLKRELGLDEGGNIEAFQQYLKVSKLSSLDDVFYAEFSSNAAGRLEYVISHKEAFIQL